MPANTSANTPANTSDQPLIEACGLGKAYRLYQRPFDHLKEALSPTRKRFSQEFWPVRDVSLQVKPGQAWGLVGENGAGKSTLLKLLCGVTSAVGRPGPAPRPHRRAAGAGGRFSPRVQRPREPGPVRRLDGPQPARTHRTPAGHPRVCRHWRLHRPSAQDLLVRHERAPGVCPGHLRRTRGIGHRRSAGRRRRGVSEKMSGLDGRLSGRRRHPDFLRP